jgi:hypothetical protein
LYSGPELSPAEETAEVDGDNVQLRLAALFPLLIDAVRNDRTWLRDFEEDRITISTDLYDVLMAYQHFRPSA